MTTLTAKPQIVFDTLAYSKKLRAVGFTEEQAEAQAETIITLITEQLATKADLKEVEFALRRDLKEVEAGLKRDIKEVELKMKEVEASLKRDIVALELKIKELETSLKRDIVALELKIKELETSLKRDIKELEISFNAKLKTEIAESKADIIKWVAAMLVAQAGLIAAMVRLL